MMMRKILIFILIISGLYNHAGAQSDSLENLLFELPDVIFKETNPPKGFKGAYSLLIKQMADLIPGLPLQYPLLMRWMHCGSC